MTLLAILWMVEAIMASVYRSSREDERLRNCDNGTARFCRYIAVIEALSFVLFITALLYVFAVCFYALGSRQWGKESVERSSIPTWHSIFFEQTQPSGQVVVVHAPAATEGHAQNVRISAPPMFTDCQCGHLVQHNHPDVQSIADDQDTKSPV
ncbi:hypothetical protein BJ165DRAFT_736005 [Panaeolus papilionaceus]|nr:hypothetical protein BJ165DRAFT_736005 [Panaeolus papilionaceus]